jgi:transitional endoplasmic reticulum ATPase
MSMRSLLDEVEDLSDLDGGREATEVFTGEEDEAVLKTVRHWMLVLLISQEHSGRMSHFDSRWLPMVAELLGLECWAAKLLKSKYAREQAARRKRAEELFDEDFFERDEHKTALEKIPSPKVFERLREMYQASKITLEEVAFPARLENNLVWLAGLLGLDELERKLLGLVVMFQIYTQLFEVSQHTERMKRDLLRCMLAQMLGVSEKEINRVLQWDGTLARTGVLRMNCELADFHDSFELLSRPFCDALYHEEGLQPIDLLRDVVRVPPAPTLTLDDFRQLGVRLTILVRYLQWAVDNQVKGVNILLFGEPGVGKTELSRVLAAACNCEIYEVECEQEHRMRHWREKSTERMDIWPAAQNMLGKGRAIVVFDEAEDVFAGSGSLFFSNPSKAQQRKGWTNRQLEENPAPMIWLSNSGAGLDPAFVRRFQMQFEVIGPQFGQQVELLAKQCGDLADRKTIERFARAKHLTPAVAGVAAGVVNVAREVIPPGQEAAILEMLMSDTLHTQGHARIAVYAKEGVPDLYDPAFISADQNLLEVAEGLAFSGSGRICLYGPPGTGKTAWGKWLANRLNKPLIVKRASDLISCYIGESEKNIARAFSEAEMAGAILLIDEVDSFLQDRRGARNSWEVTAVNEMLTQMEGFSGIFIASTNLMAGLDPASLRRFSMKVKFGYLRTDQAWQLFSRHCENLVLEVDDGLRHRLAQLNNLTPGDFAAVASQAKFRRITSSEALLAALQGECALKEDAPGRGIGFVRN